MPRKVARLQKTGQFLIENIAILSNGKDKTCCKVPRRLWGVKKAHPTAATIAVIVVMVNGGSGTRSSPERGEKFCSATYNNVAFDHPDKSDFCFSRKIATRASFNVLQSGPERVMEYSRESLVVERRRLTNSDNTGNHPVTELSPRKPFCACFSAMPYGRNGGGAGWEEGRKRDEGKPNVVIETDVSGFATKCFHEKSPLSKRGSKGIRPPLGYTSLATLCHVRKGKAQVGQFRKLEAPVNVEKVAVEEEGILSAQVSHTQDLFRSVKDQKQTTFPLRCRDSSVHVTEHVDGAQRATISLYEKILYCPSEGHKETVVPPV
uniref:Uncharacterized protein n=1 Tax=Vespula pensylvanica TaxID=30213 RepID=A0A834KUT1_VESPE|nr:hypothetical protein H0235_013203 [Vespula pensylvanica]